MNASNSQSTPTPLPVPVRSGPTAASEGWVPSADGTRIHWYTVGEGEPAIVCCDGLGCDGYIWKYIAEDLSADHRVVRWHYRGHGTSDAPQDRSRMRLSDLCDDLLAVMDLHGIEKAVLLGHSLGVQVLFEFWQRHPDRVLALVPMCGSYGRPVDTFRDTEILKHLFPHLRRVVRRFPGAVRRAWRILDTELAFQVAMRTEVNGQLVKRPDFRPYLSHLGNMDVELFFELLADASEHDAIDLLPQVDVPTLIFSGEKDAFTPAWLSNVMHARVRDSELCVIPRGTHTAPIEMPELVTLRLRRFLETRVHPLVER